MEKLTEKLEELNNIIFLRIQELIEAKGVDSEHSSEFVLKITDEEFMRNIDGTHYSGYVTEISAEYLISNNGNKYSFDAIPLEDLCLAVDSVL